jgi:hypothetical protein
MLNMVNSKLSKLYKMRLDDIFAPIALIAFLGLIVWLVYGVIKQHEEYDSSGGKFCRSSTNAFSNDIRNMCDACMLDAKGADAVQKCETRASCYNQCDKCVADASGADALKKCHTPEVESVDKSVEKSVEPFLHHVPRDSSGFAANSTVKSMERTVAKLGARYGRHA